LLRIVSALSIGTESDSLCPQPQAAAAAFSKLIAERAKPSFLVPAQQMGTPQSGKAVQGRNDGQLASGNCAA
jgi:hypothetical protein